MGAPVTANDAKASIEMMRDNQAEGTARELAGTIQLIESVDVLAPDQFAINLVMPAVSSIFDLLVGPESYISPMNAGPEQDTAPIGNGPFKLVSITPGQRFVLERSETFFEAEEVRLARIEYVNLALGPPQVNAILGGDIDLATFYSRESVDPLKASDEVNVLPMQSAEASFIWVEMCKSPGTSLMMPTFDVL